MAFAPTKGKKNLKREKGVVSLTSMMDMMTIILLFLLKTFSTSGALLQPSPFVTLPAGSRSQEPEKNLTILVNEEHGVIQAENEVSQLSQSDILSGIEELNDTTDVILPSLEQYLGNKREIAMNRPTGFNGKILIQCDSAVTYDWLIKVVSTCGKAQYKTIDFVVLKRP